MHPHCEQSGLPPNWQGVIRLSRSAVTLSVVRAKMHSLGDCGGSSYPRRTLSGSSSFGKSGFRLANWSSTRSLSFGARISSTFSPTWGVNRLNQIFRISDLSDQNWENSLNEWGRIAIWRVTVQ